jgi:hypothetical protein
MSCVTLWVVLYVVCNLLGCSVCRVQTFGLFCMSCATFWDVLHVVCNLLGCSLCRVQPFGLFSGVWCLIADGSGHCLLHSHKGVDASTRL